MYDVNNTRLLSIYDSLREVNNYLGADGRKVKRASRIPPAQYKRLNLTLVEIIQAIEEERDILGQATSSLMHDREGIMEESENWEKLARGALRRANRIYGIPPSKLVTKKDKKKVYAERPNN